MYKVYFENNRGADLVAIFAYEEDYITLNNILELMAKERGYDRITEVEVEEAIS